MNKSKFLKTTYNLEKLAKFAFKISKDTHGRQVSSRHEEVASNLFTKICLHTQGILRLLPTSSHYAKNSEFIVWDNSSISVLVRSLIETYYVLFYLSIDEQNDEEREFRFLLWDYHAENRRLEQLHLIGSSNPKLKEIQEDVDNLKEQIMNHNLFKDLKKERQGRILKGDVPFILSNVAIAEKAGINQNYHRATYINLSTYAHSYPFSISQVAAVSNIKDIAMLSKPVLDICIGYLAFAIRDFLKLVPDQKVYFVSELKEIIDTWEYIMSTLGKES